MRSSDDSDSDADALTAERPLKRSRLEEAREQQLDAAFLAPEDSSSSSSAAESPDPESKLPVALADAAHAAVLLENEDTLSGMCAVLAVAVLTPCLFRI